MISSAAQADAAVAGFLARLAEQAPVPAAPCFYALRARVLILADDIAARHTARAAHAGCRSLLRPAAVVVAAYRILSGVLPAEDLSDLLFDCWMCALHRVSPDGPDGVPLDDLPTGSRWQELGAMLFSVAGLPGVYSWLRERFASGPRSAAHAHAIEDAFWRELCAGEAVPELAGMFRAEAC